MQALKAQTSDRSSERQVMFATLLVAVLVTMMLLFEIMDRLEIESSILTLYNSLEIAFDAMVVASMAWAGPLAIREMKKRRQATVFALDSRTQVEVLFQMTDMLQSAHGYADANAVLRSTAAKLLKGLGGALYVFNNSGDRLELSTSWSWPEDSAPADTISPSHCWALKRGKPHVNLPGPNSLHCEHHDQSTVVLEIPMMARGEVYGLLAIQAGGADAEARLQIATPMAEALADAMSLALSNIALREKLRTQALRDPLTGLYNRRYMEDVLDRFAALAERTGSPLSLVMIDLDHFKRLNDEHGHAMGDAVLSEVAAAIAGSIRPGDVPCRFGGEELVVLLPDCPLAEGAAKAEVMRARIERLSENHGFKITASFGVATLSETSTRVGDVLADADTAMYRAKTEGRNRVVSAAPRPIRSVGRVSPAKAA
jgi:diguanylate cyclase (GGDEF)-like protein